MKFLARGLATAALVALAGSASAVPYTYQLNYGGNNATLTGTSAPKQSSGGSTVVNGSITTNNVGGTINGSDSSQVSAGAPALNVHVSAYSKDTSDNVTKAYLGNYQVGNGQGGLGVTNVNETGASPSHTVDNNTGNDFVVFQFDQAVSLSGARLDLWQDGTYTDGDVTIGWTNTPFTMTAGADPFSNGSFASTGIHMLNPSFTCGNNSPFVCSNDPEEVAFTSETSNIYANTWVIMADYFRNANGDDNRNDDFKITDVRVMAPGVPEPATWAMMIGGFGLIGASMRRRNRRAALAG